MNGREVNRIVSLVAAPMFTMMIARDMGLGWATSGMVACVVMNFYNLLDDIMADLRTLRNWREWRDKNPESDGKK